MISHLFLVLGCVSAVIGAVLGVVGIIFGVLEWRGL